MNVVIYTDSLTALQRNTHKDNMRLEIMTLHRLRLLKGEGRAVTLTWIPSLVGIPGNEAADRLAKLALTHDRIYSPVSLSLQKIKFWVRGTAAKRSQALLRNEDGTSTSVSWYAPATDYEPLPLPATVTRSDRVSISRLRLGYRTPRSTEQDYVGEFCTHCEEFDEQLVHYLLECEVTGVLSELTARRGYVASAERRT